METLALKNIRSLTDTGAIRIAPITILVGQNSSGKSTFARFFPLLKQGAEARTREPLLWLGRLVDFGTTEEAYSRFAKNERLGFSITTNIPSAILDGRRRVWSANSPTLEIETLEIELSYSITSIAKRYEYKFKFRNNHLELGLAEDGRVVSFIVNESDRTDLVNTTRLVASWIGPVPSLEAIDTDALVGKSAYTDLFKFVRQNLDGRTGIERAQRLTRTLTIGSVETLFNRALSASAGDEYWRRQLRNWGPASPKIKILSELVLAYQFFSEAISSIALHLRRTFINIRYITPLRASAERYYRLQGLSVEEIDPQGQNIAMFLHNLSNHEKESFEAWMTRFFGVSITTKPSQGHVSLILNSDAADGEGFNLADTGFGYSQMLPIMVQLWSIGRRRRIQSAQQPSRAPVIFAIEQPELHLHPKLQAKLADVFLTAIEAAREIDIDLRLVIESHSEQIISALGIRIARKKALPEIVNIVLFDKEELNMPTTVREVSFDSEGVLKTWPYGFFEADL